MPRLYFLLQSMTPCPYPASPGRKQRRLWNSCGTDVPAASSQKPDCSITHEQQGYSHLLPCEGGPELALPHSKIQPFPLTSTLQSQNSLIFPSSSSFISQASHPVHLYCINAWSQNKKGKLIAAGFAGHIHSLTTPFCHRTSLSLLCH